MIHREDLLEVSGSQGRGAPIKEETRKRLGLSPDEVRALVRIYGCAVAVPLIATGANVPIGCICVDTPAGVEFRRDGLSWIEEFLVGCSEALAGLLLGDSRNLRDEVVVGQADPV